MKKITILATLALLTLNSFSQSEIKNKNNISLGNYHAYKGKEVKSMMLISTLMGTLVTVLSEKNNSTPMKFIGITMMSVSLPLAFISDNKTRKGRNIIKKFK